MSEKDYMWRPPQIRKEKIVSTTLSNSLVRRRRKRARNSEDESNRPLTMFFSRTLPSLDDTVLAFLDRNGDILADSQATPSSIPILLEARRSGHWKGRSKNWELRMLKNHIRKPHPGHSRRQWRSFAQRAIPFTHLGTPHGDAVLAMDRQGSKVICLGSKDIWNAPLALALRLYGMSTTSGRNDMVVTLHSHPDVWFKLCC